MPSARPRGVATRSLPNLERGRASALRCSVTVDRQVVVDVWGGWTDPLAGASGPRDTMVNAFSVGKPVIALRLLQLDRAWPDRASTPGRTAGGPSCSAGQTRRDRPGLLCHRAGVPAIREPLANDALWSWRAHVQAIAATDPWWEPGTRATPTTRNTYGHLVGRGRPEDRRPAPRHLAARRRSPGRSMPSSSGASRRPTGHGARTSSGRSTSPRGSRVATARAATADAAHDRPRLRQSARLLGHRRGEQRRVASRAGAVDRSLHATARGVARLYTALAAGGAVDGISVLGADLLAEATVGAVGGLVPGARATTATFGLGFQPTRPDRPFGPNPGASATSGRAARSASPIRRPAPVGTYDRSGRPAEPRDRRRSTLEAGRAASTPGRRQRRDRPVASGAAAGEPDQDGHRPQRRRRSERQRAAGERRRRRRRATRRRRRHAVRTHRASAVLGRHGQRRVAEPGRPRLGLPVEVGRDLERSPPRPAARPPRPRWPPRPGRAARRRARPPGPRRRTPRARRSGRPCR